MNVIHSGTFALTFDTISFTLHMYRPSAFLYYGNMGLWMFLYVSRNWNHYWRGPTKDYGTVLRVRLACSEENPN